MKHRDKLSELPAAAAHPPARSATWLIRCAARHAPTDLGPRLEEEWRADLSAQSGLLAQWRFALGCCWATQVIAHDPIAVGVSARGAVTAHGTMAAFAPATLAPNSSRSTVVMLVLALHVAVIYAFVTGLIGPLHVQSPPTPIDAYFFKDPKVPTPPPPGPKPQLDPWHTLVPIPLGPLSITPQTGTVIESAGQPMQPTAAQPQAMIRVAGGPGAGFPATDIFYPAASRRLGETGATAVRVCVDQHGRLIGDPSVAESSGFVRLDGGALALARAGSGYYRSTTEDGKAVSSCYAFRVRFQMR